MLFIRKILLAVHSAKIVGLDAWKGRFVVWTAAATAGLVVGFAKATEYAITFFFSLQKENWWMPLILTPVAGICIVWATNRWFAGAAGSGIPQAEFIETPSVQHDISVSSA